MATATATEAQAATLASMPDVLTISETMRVLRLGRTAVMGLIERGEIAARKTCPGKGGRWLVPRSSVEAYLGIW